MGHTDSWLTVVADAGPFYRFENHVHVLLSHLKGKLVVSQEVRNELDLGIKRSQRTGEHLALKMTTMTPGVPAVKSLSPASSSELDDRLRALRKPGEHLLEHAGEIATVLLAVEIQPALVIVDDGEGKRLAKRKGITRIGTGHLVAEMVKTGTLSRAQGLEIFMRLDENLQPKYLDDLIRRVP